MGGSSKGGSTASYSTRPLTSNEMSLIDSQTDYNTQASKMAIEAANRSAKTQADYNAYYKNAEVGATDPNSQLYAATVAGNDSNQSALNSFLSGSKQNTDAYNMGNGMLSNAYAHKINQNANQYGADAMANAQNTADTIGGYANDYNNFMGGINSSMGQADQGVLARLRAENTSGLSTANNTASRSLQAQLAQRGMVNSGVGAKALTDLNTNYMNTLGGANANAYGQAVNQSDQMRMNQVGLNNQRLQGMIGASQAGGEAVGGAIDKQYNANQSALGTGYGAKGNALNTAYGANNTQQGGALNAISSANQQRIGNMQNYAQLGRGMSGISSNYLGQAGQGFSQAASNAGNMFGQSVNANNSYNSAINQANQANSAAKGAGNAGFGSLIGTGIGAYAASDRQLKDNITQIGIIGNLPLYTWVWNDEAVRIGANVFPAIGVIAQEAQELYPDAVVEHENGYLAVDYNKIIAYAKDSK